MKIILQRVVLLYIICPHHITISLNDYQNFIWVYLMISYVVHMIESSNGTAATPEFI